MVHITTINHYSYVQHYYKIYLNTFIKIDTKIIKDIHSFAQYFYVIISYYYYINYYVLYQASTIVFVL